MIYPGKFCVVCGSEMTKVGNVTAYNSENGNAVYEKKCSKNPCHTYHNYSNPKKQSVHSNKYLQSFRIFLNLFFENSANLNVGKRCSDCGKEYIEPMYEGYL